MNKQAESRCHLCAAVRNLEAQVEHVARVAAWAERHTDLGSAVREGPKRTPKHKSVCGKNWWVMEELVFGSLQMLTVIRMSWSDCSAA